ncbi:odorant receptor 45a-like [Anastrepha obliqua]|uniref:odorant receptor 45a-like n=1 Tax=Anastrepha obliqua TaxID=95512 RepID=UPI00240A171E|nr:odorant receptor 45a-like [Anastrepha obliqua]
MRITTLKDITAVAGAFERVGINIELSHRKGTFTHPERYITALTSVIIWCMALITYIIKNFNEIDKLLTPLILEMQFLHAIFKSLFFLARRKQFLRLNEALERLAWRGNQSERELWNDQNRRVHTITRAYDISCQLNIGSAALLPLLKLLYYYIWYNEVVLTLPMPGTFPYDNTVPFYYILSSIFSALTGFFCWNNVTAVDGLFGWFVYNISAHFQILRLKLEHLLQLQTDDPQFQVDFAAFITYHKQIISFTLELDAVYAPIIFFEAISSGIPICVLAYQLIYLSDPSSILFICTLIAAFIVQLMIYCTGGEKIQSECEELCKNIYLLVPWYNIPPKHCRLYLMPLMRSQRVLALRGYFFTANHSLLVWTFRAAGSFTAMLAALKDKQK